MRSIFSVLLLFLLSIQALSQDAKPVVVVELFTSEGCSSCPPADRLLSSIVQADTDVEILGLSFHVDYWDYIGWKDPYASEIYTLRQRAYARKFRLNTIYTPQMIVNGKHEFVGSSRSEWNRALALESRDVPSLDLDVSIISKTTDKLTFTVKSKPTDAQINVAIVEKNLSQDVKRGENRGRKLSHDNVVRSFDTRSFDGQQNTFKLRLPADLKLENASLIIYSQSSENWKVNGGKKISIASIAP